MYIITKYYCGVLYHYKSGHFLVLFENFGLRLKYNIVIVCLYIFILYGYCIA